MLNFPVSTGRLVPFVAQLKELVKHIPDERGVIPHTNLLGNGRCINAQRAFVQVVQV
jgi:hypothetical protein